MVNQGIIDLENMAKKQANFPAMTWKDTINNMFILDNWKKKLFKIENEKNN